MDKQQLSICECGTPMGRINGRTLNEAQAATKVVFPGDKYTLTQWVHICPSCHSHVLSTGTYSWPFQSADGAMRVVEDYENHKLRGSGAVLDLLGFAFSENALMSADTLLARDSSQLTDLIKLGSALSNSTSASDFFEFSDGVCEWGRGGRVWGNLKRRNKTDLGQKMKAWLLFAKKPTTDTEAAIQKGIEIPGLAVSFASKHLRMLDQERYPVLDDVLSKGLGIALNPKGYKLFVRELERLQSLLARPLPIGQLEAAIFLLIRQDVRSIS